MNSQIKNNSEVWIGLQQKSVSMESGYITIPPNPKLFKFFYTAVFMEVSLPRHDCGHWWLPLSPNSFLSWEMEDGTDKPKLLTIN
jgi:hypothetical protein